MNVQKCKYMFLSDITVLHIFDRLGDHTTKKKENYNKKYN